MPEESPTVALLTDFGTRDPYVAAMKGVLLAGCGATLVDLGHDLPPFDPFAAGLFLRAIVSYYPRRPDPASRMIFVAVIDPGVGTSRKILAAEEEGQVFVAPDNGLLSLVLGEEAAIHSAENPAYFLPGGSSTFHGRDRFAPVAAALANGIELRELGPRVPRQSMVKLEYEVPCYEAEKAVGTVVSIDHFGNVITDLEVVRIPSLERAVARVGLREVRDFSGTYGERSGSKEPFMIVGSSGSVEISLASASAAEVLQIRRFDRVEIQYKG
ncbi:MAG: SAM-dependent chlorinase/fluorinase [Thermoanaerobaculia bacterium]